MVKAEQLTEAEITLIHQLAIAFMTGNPEMKLNDAIIDAAIEWADAGRPIATAGMTRTVESARGTLRISPSGSTLETK